MPKKESEHELYLKNMYYVAGYAQGRAGLPMDNLTEGLQSDLKFLIHHASTNPNNSEPVSQLIAALRNKFKLED